MKKISIVLFLVLNIHALSAAMTKDFVVTKLHYDLEKKYYQVDFKNQAGVYQAQVAMLSCLRESLQNKKAVRVEFNPMGLKITNCSKVSSR